MINRFDGKYFFLSNFYPCKVTYLGHTYQNTEAAFHAMKVLDEEVRKQFENLSASESKKLGRQVSLRKDWEQIKDSFMYDIVTEKFLQNPDLKAQLLATGDEELVEGTYWHDTYWGIDLKTGRGKNKLGQILMKVREELNNV